MDSDATPIPFLNSLSGTSKLFTSYGELNINVIEATDLLDYLTLKVKRVHHVFFKAVVYNEEKSPSHYYCTACQPYLEGILDLRNESFCFENVLSSFTVILYLYIDENSQNAGFVFIPVSRLEEDTPIKQWYQLFSNKHNTLNVSSLSEPPSHDDINFKGLRSSIRLEICFKKSGQRIQPPVPQRTLSSTATLGGSSDSDSFSIQPGSKSPHRDSKMDLSPSSKLKMTNKPFSMVDVKRPSVNSNTMIDEKKHYRPQNLTFDDGVPVGLIEYCVLIGPRTVSSAGTESASLHEESAVCIWDRFPLQDHPYSSLPHKIEWFACPRGAMRRRSKSRPQPQLSSFVMLSGQQGNEEQYGSCITFFVKQSQLNKIAQSNPSPFRILSDDLESNHSPTRTNYTETSYYSEDLQQQQYQQQGSFDWALMRDFKTMPKILRRKEKKNYYYSGGAEERKMETHEDVIEWMGICLCLLSKGPFIMQLWQALHCGYYSDILPALIQWELEENEADSGKGGKRDEGTLKLRLEKLMVILTLEAPVPLAGHLKINLVYPLRPSLKPKKSNQYRPLDYIPPRPIVDVNNIEFSLAPLEKLPTCPFPLDALVSFLGVRTAVDVLCCALVERRLLFHSTDNNKLPIICEAVRTLLYPMRWGHVYVPVVPSALLDLIEAPVPFILGVLTSLLQQVPPDYLRDVVMVDCDSGVLVIGSLSVLRMPEPLDRWLVMSLKDIMNPRNNSCIHPYQSESDNRSMKIQYLFFDALTSLLSPMLECLFFLDANTPIFNRSLFLQEFSSLESRIFLEAVTDSHAFQCMTSLIQAPCLSFFVQCSESLSHRPVPLNPLPRLSRTSTPESAEFLSSASSSTDNVPTMRTLHRPSSFRNIPRGSSGRSQSPPPTYISTSTTLQSSNGSSSFRLPTSPTTGLERKVSWYGGTGPMTGDAVDKMDESSHKILERKSSRQEGRQGTLKEFLPDWVVHPTVSEEYIAQDFHNILQKRFDMIDKLVIATSTSSSSIPTTDSGNLHGDNQKATSNGSEVPIPTLVLSLASSESTDIDYQVSHQHHRRLLQLERGGSFDSFKMARMSYYGSTAALYQQPADPSTCLTLQKVIRKLSSVALVNVSGGSEEMAQEYGGLEGGPPSHSFSKMMLSSDSRDSSFKSKNFDIQKSGDSAIMSPRPMDSNSNLPSPLICFHSRALLMASHKTKLWTINSVAQATNTKPDRFLNALLVLGGVDDSPTRRGLSSPTTTTAIQFRPDLSIGRSDDVPGAEHINKFLETAFSARTSSIGGMQGTEALLKDCSRALLTSSNRKRLLDILRQSSRSRSNSSSSSKPGGSGSGPVSSWRLYTIQFSVFELLLKLCEALLQACLLSSDYLTAYALLEVSGSYYTTLEEHQSLPLQCTTINSNNNISQLGNKEKKEESNIEIEDINFQEAENAGTMSSLPHEVVCEFLSSSLGQHPIYQNKALWLAVVHHRINNRLYGSPVKNDLHTTSHMVTQEARSLLFTMYGVGVNIERAMLFIQAVATDYRLDIELFFNLQRFTTGLWENKISLDSRSNKFSSHPPSRDITRPGSKNNSKKSLDSHSRRSSKGSKDRDYEHGSYLSSDDSSDDEDEDHDDDDDADTEEQVETLWNKELMISRELSALDNLHNRQSDSLESDITIKKKKNPIDEDYGTFVASGSGSGSSFLGRDMLFDKKNEKEEERKVAESRVKLQEALQDKDCEGTVTCQDVRKFLEMDMDVNENTVDDTRDREKYHQVIIEDGNHGSYISAMDCHRNWLITGAGDGSIHVTDMEQTKRVLRHSHKTAISCLVCLPDGDGFVSACTEGVLKIWKLPRPKDSCLPLTGNNNISVSYGEKDKEKERGNSNSAAGSSSSSPSQWTTTGSSMNILNRQRVAMLNNTPKPVTALVVGGGKEISGVIADEWLMAAGDSAGVIKVYRGGNGGRELKEVVTVSLPLLPGSHTGCKAITTLALPHHLHRRHHGTYSSDSGGNNSDIAGLANASSSSSSAVADSTVNRIHRTPSIRYTSRCDTVLGVGAADGCVTAIDYLTGQIIFQHRSHQSAVSVVLMIRSQEILSASYDRTVRLWDLRSKSCSTVISAGFAAITTAIVSESNESLIVTAGADGTIRFWDTRFDISHPYVCLQGHTDRISQICWDAGGGQLCSASYDHSVMTWDGISDTSKQILRNVHNNASRQGLSHMCTSYSVSSSENLLRNTLATAPVSAAGVGVAQNPSSPRSPSGFDEFPKGDSSSNVYRRFIATGSWDGAVNLYVSNSPANILHD